MPLTTNGALASTFAFLPLFSPPPYGSMCVDLCFNLTAAPITFTVCGHDECWFDGTLLCFGKTWGSGPLLHMAGYSSLQGIGISLLKYRWCYESVQNYGTKLGQNVHTIGGLICG